MFKVAWPLPVLQQFGLAAVLLVYVSDRKLICIQKVQIYHIFLFSSYSLGWKCWFRLFLRMRKGPEVQRYRHGQLPTTQWSSSSAVKPRAQLCCGDLTTGVWCRLLALPHSVSWVLWVLQLEQDITGLLHCKRNVLNASLFCTPCSLGGTKEAFFHLSTLDGFLLFQQVPLVEIDGMKMVQTRAIMSYIAGKYNLHGKDLKERALYVTSPMSVWDRMDQSVIW